VANRLANKFNAKAIITPCSHWTAIANLQKVPVISWGNTVGQYKEQGLYHFNNNLSRSIYYDDDAKIENLIGQIDRYLMEIG